MSKNDGGSAFPCPAGHIECRHPIGMSMRDYFAAKAMAALVSTGDEGAGDRIGEIPEYAYQIADAMLEARDA